MISVDLSELFQSDGKVLADGRCPKAVQFISVLSSLTLSLLSLVAMSTLMESQLTGDEVVSAGLYTGKFGKG